MIRLFLTKTNENQSETARALLFSALARDYGITAPEILSAEKGKPYIPGGPFFSISHSRGYAAVAIGEGELGLDLELVRPFPEKLPKRILSPEEYQWFLSRRETKADFFTLWTLKESYYKYLGTGLPGFPNGTEFYKDKSWHLKGSDLHFTVLEEKNLLIALCSDKQMEITLIWQ